MQRSSPVMRPLQTPSRTLTQFSNRGGYDVSNLLSCPTTPRPPSRPISPLPYMPAPLLQSSMFMPSPPPPIRQSPASTTHIVDLALMCDGGVGVTAASNRPGSRPAIVQTGPRTIEVDLTSLINQPLPPPPPPPSLQQRSTSPIYRPSTPVLTPRISVAARPTSPMFLTASSTFTPAPPVPPATPYTPPPPAYVNPFAGSLLDSFSLGLFLSSLSSIYPAAQYEFATLLRGLELSALNIPYYGSILPPQLPSPPAPYAQSPYPGYPPRYY